MVYNLKKLFLEAMFEFYGMLHHRYLERARCAEEGNQRAFNFWIRRAEKCIDKRDDILERLFA